MKIVGISGSLRRHSSNAALLRAAGRVVPAGVEVIIYDGLGGLPHFNPDLDEEGATPPDSVATLRSLLIDADAVLISSPEYAHGVPGVLKNMLDWLVSTGELVGKPVALPECVTCRRQVRAGIAARDAANDELESRAGSIAHGAIRSSQDRRRGDR